MAHWDTLAVGQWVRAEFMAHFRTNVPWAHATTTTGASIRIQEGQLGRVDDVQDGVAVNFLVAGRLVTVTEINVALMVPATPTEEESDAWLIHLLTH